MALESSFVNIVDLVAANPGDGDLKNQGDNHIRGVKAVLRNAFAGFTGAVLITGTDGGAANAYTLTPTTALPAYGTKMLVVFSPTANNTGASTMNISGLGTTSIKSVSGAAMVLGDLIVGQFYVALYTATELRLISMTKNYIDQLAFTSVLPSQTGNSGKYITTDGTNASWAAVDTNPIFVDKGNSGTTTQTLDFSAGQNQRIANTGAHTIATSNWPASGKLGALLLELANGAAFTITWPTVNWIKSDGSTTTTFSSNGVTLQTSGIDFILLWTRNGGTTIYGKIVR